LPVFAYKAVDVAGRSIDGTLAADTPAVGRQRLREQGLRLLEFAPARFRSRRGWPKLRRRKRQEDVAELARQLALLLRAGIPLVEAVDVLIRQARGKVQSVLRDVRDRIAGGASFAEALEQHTEWFDPVFCSAVRVGQSAGRMEQALGDLARYMHEREGVRNRLFMALAYPAILSVVGLGVVLFLMSYVVPQLLAVLESSGRSLPVATVVLRSASNVLIEHWLFLLCTGAAMAVGIVAVHRWPRGRRSFHTMQLRLPLAGVLVRKTLVAQFAQMMALLLSSGVAFLEAVSLVRKGCRNLVLSEELSAMESAVQRGSDIAPAIEQSKIFPPLVIHVVNVGQKSGELTEMLSQLAEGYADEVRVAVGKFSAALEPALIVVMAVVVGFIVFATMMPILEATRAIQ